MAQDTANHARPTRWRWFFDWFSGYACKYVGKHFCAVSVSADAPPPELDDRPTVVVVNHPSWWDPMIYFLVCRRFYPGRSHYAPIDARALAKYRFFEKLGLFGLDLDSAAGARAFLRAGEAILAQPGAMLWVTAQGKFTDVRARPVVFEPGAAHMIRRVPGVRVMTMAVEYAFWDQKQPQIFLRFSEAETLPGGGDVEAIRSSLEQAMERALSDLAVQVTARDENAFTVVQRGRVGVGGAYDGWRRLASWARGRRFDPRHRVE